MLRLHRLMMSFFFVGYIVVAIGFLFGLEVIGQIMVALVFLFGAAFVLSGIVLQSRMLLEIRTTFHGVVPICTRCRRVRQPNADPNDRDAWLELEGFVSSSSEAGLSEGFCPDCMDRLYGLHEAG